MAENKAVRTQSQDVSRSSPTPSVFAPMVPFRDFFGVNPFAFMREFAKEMDRGFGRDLRWGNMTSGSWTPVIEVKETDGTLVVTAELPGIKAEDVKVEITGDGLAVHGERHEEKKEEKEGFYRSERSYGRFYRLVPLPEGTKVDQIKAELNKGILQITVPLPEGKQKGKQIPVTSAEEAQSADKKTAA